MRASSTGRDPPEATGIGERIEGHMPRPSTKTATPAKAVAKKTMRAGRSQAGPEMTKVDLDFLPSTIGYFLRRLQQAYKEHFLATTPGLDMAPKDVSALFVVARNAGLSPSQFSSALGIDGAMASMQLAALERRGLLKREKSVIDGRSRIITLTPEGATMITKLRRTVASVDVQFTDVLDEKERVVLLGLMARLLAAHAGDLVMKGSARR
jgi:DNA-binding MarR family transcriptional regulator